MEQHLLRLQQRPFQLQLVAEVPLQQIVALQEQMELIQLFRQLHQQVVVLVVLKIHPVLQQVDTEVLEDQEEDQVEIELVQQEQVIHLPYLLLKVFLVIIHKLPADRLVVAEVAQQSQVLKEQDHPLLKQEEMAEMELILLLQVVLLFMQVVVEEVQ